MRYKFLILLWEGDQWVTPFWRNFVRAIHWITGMSARTIALAFSLVGSAGGAAAIAWKALHGDDIVWNSMTVAIIALYTMKALYAIEWSEGLPDHKIFERDPIIIAYRSLLNGSLAGGLIRLGTGIADDPVNEALSYISMFVFIIGLYAIGSQIGRGDSVARRVLESPRLRPATEGGN